MNKHFILFSINCLGTRCPPSRQSRSRNFFFLLNIPKLSEGKLRLAWPTGHLCALLSQIRCCLYWCRSPLRHRKTPQLPPTIEGILDSHPLLCHCSPKADHSASGREGLREQLPATVQSVHLHTFIHSGHICDCVCVLKQEKMARRIYCKYWYWLSDIFAE